VLFLRRQKMARACSYAPSLNARISEFDYLQTAP
jgi:hypothetical protein